MIETLDAGRCLNCGAPLHGPFCAACGQRAVPPNPTVRELAGDAWHELSGYDGRIMATVRGLVRPGFLTRQYLAGQRARYLPPVRVYLIVSVLYFVVAAAAPERSDDDITGPGVRIEVTGREPGAPEMSEEDRAALIRAQAERAPWLYRPVLLAFAEDPAGLRARIFTVMPRVFVAMLPVFAAIVALFYRRRNFPTALVFAVHVHAFAFVVFTLSEAAKFLSEALAIAVGLLAGLAFVVYALMAFRAVFGGRWLVAVLKAAGIGVVYMIAAIPAFMIILLWASWM